MTTLTITAKTREARGRKTNALRAEGQVPAILYGFGTEPQNITIDRNEAIKLYSEAGESTVVNLNVDGAEHPVLIADLQFDPLTDFITHMDFRRIDMSKKVQVDVTIVLTGEAPAVKSLGGTLVQSQESIEVEALPSALVNEIIVDISGLNTFEDAIRVSDLKIPEGITVLTKADQTVATVQPPRSESEMQSLDAPVVADVSAVETSQGAPKDAEGEAKEGDAKAE